MFVHSVKQYCMFRSITSKYIYKLKLKGRRFKTKNELWSEVMKAWNEIPVSTCMKLVDSMPRRMLAIIRAKGWNTKY
jgi:hypothetical protein